MVSHMDEELSFEDEEQEPTPNGAPAGSVSVTMSEDNDFDDINEKLQQIEQEAQKIREMQNEMEKQFQSGTAVTGTGSPVIPNPMSLEEKQLVDARSIYVGNVDYSATPDQLEEHFRGCGAIERVTILTDKFTGHPKGFAYIQFADVEAVNTSTSLNDSLFLGRQIKVVPKRTNVPGLSSTNRPPRGMRGGRGTGRARVIVKYIYPGMRSRGRPPRRRGGFYTPY
ncbi:hypothetical protein niasHS_005447 [Heterodera schachtii]|uniref:RRM domain-containing protein n=2 Tax=Heterodera TaxID=34509 RepID=A0ABD2L758_9BILA